MCGARKREWQKKQPYNSGKTTDSQPLEVKSNPETVLEQRNTRFYQKFDPRSARAKHPTPSLNL